jgi:hypothetical protein
MAFLPEFRLLVAGRIGDPFALVSRSDPGVT